MDRKVIINCAVTGAIHVPSLSPYLPITPAQIAAEAVAAAEAGAATVHLHARDPQNGRPDMEPELFRTFCRQISKGELAKSNADLVAKMRRIITELSFDIADPAEARKMLGLKGKDATSF